ncbi:unnamed protein product [Symbiodinium natans]|uniref:Uncharacterized protein n=1 Tax=Symbiodinium natans TaxID=878477 RepID=A0A812RLB5_9DINO|nr:unnamed protein product [Symbiodinium natans]
MSTRRQDFLRESELQERQNEAHIRLLNYSKKLEKAIKVLTEELPEGSIWRDAQVAQFLSFCPQYQRLNSMADLLRTEVSLIQQILRLMVQPPSEDQKEALRVGLKQSADLQLRIHMSYFQAFETLVGGLRLQNRFEAPRELSAEVDRSPDEALRRQLASALRSHEECCEQAEAVWRLTEAGCDIGTRKHELELEQAACNVQEKDLTQACRDLCAAAKQAAAASGPSAVADAARSYVVQWQAVEAGLPQRWPQAEWPAVLQAADALDAERASQDSLSKQLSLETKREALLRAELDAPAEAKRALATLRLDLSCGEQGRGCSSRLYTRNLYAGLL